MAGTVDKVMRGFKDGWPHLGSHKAMMLHAIWSRFLRRGGGAYRCIVPLTFTFGDTVMGLGR